MKLKFKHQRFQAEAAQCVVRAFEGQPYHTPQDYLIDRGRRPMSDMYELLGYSNSPLMIDRGSIAENVRAVQMEQGLKPIEVLEGSDVHLTIEMETGTGKTYTYIKTMFELNKYYGWNKFIIVVPSKAIREGVSKSFEVMQDHFAFEYGKRIQHFVYSSKDLNKIDAFASDSGMHVMIINTQAFNASLNEEKNKEGRGGDAAARIIYSRREEFGYRRPIDVLAKTNPVMIIDEPQSVLGANASNATRVGLKKFNPLFYLLYSATHREVMNMVYRLDALDAYNKKLVKKIEVKGISQKGLNATNGYVSLEEIVISKGNPRARISFDVISNSGQAKQVSKLVDESFDLYEHSGGLAEYRDKYIVERIDGVAGTVRFLNGIELSEGEVIGQVNEDYLRRLQIRETIRTHLDRERQLFPKGIKVLSLFFIDHVENYRVYSKEGKSNGKFAEMFEEEYRNVVSEMQPSFKDEAFARYLSKYSAEQVHDGYFSQDKTGKMIDSKIKRGETSSDDESAYNLIMKNKERLLSFSEPRRFIFSHSALKEGWDNPNVFQICTLRETSNEIKKRQEVGRGMRLCVNDKGERQDAEVLGESGVFDTNVLTVIASESYESFARNLQSEIAEAVADRPVEVTAYLFEDLVTVTAEGKQVKITRAQAVEIHDGLILSGYLRGNKLTEKYFNDKRSGVLDFGQELNPLKDFIVQQLDKVFDPSRIKPENGRKPREARFQEEVFKKKEFQALWKRINVKTYYEVDFETEELIQKTIKAIDAHLNVTEIRVVVETGELGEIHDKESLYAGVAMKQGKTRTIHVKENVGSSVKYDLVGKLVEATGLTRKTIVAILKGILPAKFDQFKVNPEEFIVKVGNIINDEKAMAVVQKIVYHKTSNTFDTDIFSESALRGKIGVNAIESVKSLYDLVVVDSEGVEKQFAESLEKEDDVLVYTKLPRGFYINTPMGKYNPDWAVAFREGTVKHIYFIAETKGNEWQRSQLRGAEDSKVECAARHFETISQDGNVKYGVARDYTTLYNLVTK